MKVAYEGFEAKRSSNFTQLPPVGAYIGEIQAVKVEEDFDKTREVLVLMLEITEGEYKNRYHEVLKEQQEKFGGNVKYKGSIRIKIPKNDDPDDLQWIRGKFSDQICCVQESNDGYTWDWDENKLVGKAVGFSVRESIYTGNDGSEKHTTEIGQLVSIPDIKNGKVRPMKARDSRRSGTNVSDKATNVTGKVEVPF